MQNTLRTLGPKEALVAIHHGAGAGVVRAEDVSTSLDRNLSAAR